MNCVYGNDTHEHGVRQLRGDEPLGSVARRLVRVPVNTVYSTVRITLPRQVTG